MANYDYRAARDRIMGMTRDTEGRVVAYKRGPATIKERALLLVLVEFAPDIRPATSTLAIMLGTSEREVRRLLRSAESKGLIRTEQRPGRASRYHLVADPGGCVPPADVSPRTDAPPTPANMSGGPRRICPPKQTIQADKEAEGCASRGDTLTPALVLESPALEPKARKAPKARARASKPKVEQTSEHKLVVDHYFRVFEALRGVKPTFDGADGTAIKNLLKKCKNDPELACRAISDGFASWKGDTLSVRVIAKDPAQFIGAKARNNASALKVQNAGLDPLGESI